MIQRSACWRAQSRAMGRMTWELIAVVATLTTSNCCSGNRSRRRTELKTWYQGMVGSSSEQGFGQRGEQNWSWVNQSIIAVTHRLTRPVNYKDRKSTRLNSSHL